MTSPIDNERVPGELDSARPPFFNPHDTARSYSSTAAVLAGFCFAAIVLLINLQQSAPGRFGSAVGALLTAFLGLVISAFLSALVAGQTRVSTRSFWMAHLAGITLATSGLFALWGLVDVVAVAFSNADVALDADVISLLHWVFVVASGLISAFVWAASVNLRRIAGAKQLKGNAIALAVIGVAGMLVAKWLFATMFGVSETKPIDTIAYVQLGALVVAVLGALCLSSFGQLQDPRGGLATLLTMLLVAVPPIFATLLYLRLPNNRPPDCTEVTATPEILAADAEPDDKWSRISLTGERDPDGDPTRVTISGVTQDEPVKDVLDRDGGPDAEVGESSSEVYVYAEAGSYGRGRVYRIAFRVSDDSNATCSGSSRVRVPLHKGERAVESAPASFDSFGR